MRSLLEKRVIAKEYVTGEYEEKQIKALILKKSDIGPVLRENFSWKDEDFSWTKDAIALSPALKNEFRTLYEGFLFSDFKEEVLSTIKKFTTGDESWYFQHLKEIPSECKAYKEIHNIMLPNKRKSIIHRIYFYIDTFILQYFS